MTRTTLLCLVLTLAACGGSDAPATTPATSEPSPGAEQPSSPGVEEPAPAATGQAPGCDQEIALTCESGFTDGCLSKLTTKHVCVADSEKKAGPPDCKMEIARTCPDGQVDACLTKPRLAKSHICVVAPK